MSFGILWIFLLPFHYRTFFGFYLNSFAPTIECVLVQQLMHPILQRQDGCFCRCHDICRQITTDQMLVSLSEHRLHIGDLFLRVVLCVRVLLFFTCGNYVPKIILKIYKIKSQTISFAVNYPLYIVHVARV